MTIPVLTPQQRRAWPLLALALDCLREPRTGEAVIDLRVRADGRPPRGERVTVDSARTPAGKKKRARIARTTQTHNTHRQEECSDG